MSDMQLDATPAEMAIDAQATVEDAPSNTGHNTQIAGGTEGPLSSTDFRVVEVPQADGTLQQFKAIQIPLTQAYEQHVAEHGRRIADSEEDDRRLWSALQFAQSSAGNPEMAEALQKITTSEQLLAYFTERNRFGRAGNNPENMKRLGHQRHAALIAQAARALEDGTSPTSEAVKYTVEELQKRNMVEDAPDVKLTENTVAARVAKIRELQALGYDVEIGNASDELRDALGIPKDEHDMLAENAAKAEVAVAGGLLTDDTLDASTNPTAAQALTTQVQGAAVLIRAARANADPMARCSHPQGARVGRVFTFSARDFSNEIAKLGTGHERVDKGLPIAPIVAEDFLGKVFATSLGADLYAMRLDTLVRTSKLYLLVTGVPSESSLLFTDVKMFYIGLLKFLAGTDLRPSEVKLREKEQAEREATAQRLQALGLSAAVNNEPVPDDKRTEHSKERILTIRTLVEHEAMEKFFNTVREAIAGVAGGDDLAVRQCLADIHEAQRVLCIETLNAYELAIMLFYERQIPMQYRQALMTPIENVCDACASTEAKKNVVARREWVQHFRRTQYLFNEATYEKRFSLGHLQAPNQGHDKVDLTRKVAPSYQEVWEFVRFIALKISETQFEANEPDAVKYVARYVNQMQTSAPTAPNQVAKHKAKGKK